MDQGAIAVSHMRDLLRSRPPNFDDSSNDMEVENWILDLGRHFSMHPCSSNTKDRCVIIHLHEFDLSWWCTEEQKLQLDITMISWELFLEHFHAQFLSDHWRQRKTDEFHDLRQ